MKDIPEGLPGWKITSLLDHLPSKMRKKEDISPEVFFLNLQFHVLGGLKYRVS